MWRSKQDVLNDLPGYSKLRCSFDDSHFVQGFAPPPVTRHEDDIDEEELQARFGEEYNVTSLNCQPVDPDLHAITESLRMVDTFDKPERLKAQTEDEENSTMIVISKLDPNVHEFVPTAKVRSTSQQAISTVKQNNGTGNTTNDETLNNSTKLDEDSIAKQELDAKALEQKLKNKICSKTKPSTIQQKRERNVAIAALLRLKTTSTPPKSPSSTPKCSSPQPKLDSPKKLVTEDKLDTLKPTVPQESMHLLTPKYFEGPSAKADENAQLTPELEPLIELPNTSQSQEMKESIEKVDNWLNPPVKVKSAQPAPHIGTVQFRKKETPRGTPTSALSESSKRTDADITPAPPQEFVPSSYAIELRKKFEERVRANEEMARKNETPTDRLKPLEGIGLSFTFKRSSKENGHEL